jgi:hypothetical protein
VVPAQDQVLADQVVLVQGRLQDQAIVADQAALLVAAVHQAHTIAAVRQAVAVRPAHTAAVVAVVAVVVVAAAEAEEVADAEDKQLQKS